MFVMSLLRKLACLTAATFLFFSANANAIPIVYEFSGVSNGSFNGVDFTNRGFTVDLFSDTSTVVDFAPGILVNPASSVTFSISGIGSGTLSDAYRVFRTANAIGFQQVPDAVDRISIDGAFSAYTLASAFGPVTGANTIGSFQPDPTAAGGELELFQGTNVSFRSFFTVTQIPEPASLVLLALGLAGLGLSRRKRAS